MILRKIEEIQAGNCFIGKDGIPNDFFRNYLDIEGIGEERDYIWKIVGIENTTVKRVMYGNIPFLVPKTMQSLLPDGYLIQENVLLIRLKSTLETIPLFFPGAEGYDLLKDDKVLYLIERHGKKIKRFGVHFDEQEKKLHYINEVLVTMDELTCNRESWGEILMGYPSLVASSYTLGVFTLTLNKNQFIIDYTNETPPLTNLAKAVTEMCVPHK